MIPVHLQVIDAVAEKNFSDLGTGFYSCLQITVIVLTLSTIVFLFCSF